MVPASANQRASDVLLHVVEPSKREAESTPGRIFSSGLVTSVRIAEPQVMEIALLGAKER